MNIDFSMTEINLPLICGIVLLLQGICLLVMQNPFKNIRKFKAKDYIIFVLILCFVIIGVVLTAIGVGMAANLLM